MTIQKLVPFLRILAAISALLISGCVANNSHPTGQEISLTPEEVRTYYDYVQAIGGEPSISDSATIEATVVSITRSDKCPSSSGETCDTEPYPNDWATVRVDKIMKYTPYTETPTAPVEGKQQSEPTQTTPGYAGKEPPAPKKTGYAPLKEGQEVSAHFILTTRPAKVRYVPEIKPTGGLETGRYLPAAESKEGIRDSQTGTSGPATPGKTIFKPIPKEGGYLIFTTKVGDYPQAIEKTLPGLKEGDRFTAEIRYDGTVYIEEYTIN